MQTRRARQEDQSNIRFEQISTCPECRGTGVAIEEPCLKCSGSGRVEQESAVRIRIPPGIEEGATLRIPKHGLPGEPSGEPGDLYVVVYSTPDVRFQRRGADLWKAETIAVEDAVLGTKIHVSTLDGEVEVKIPPGIQPDEVLRLKGKGLPRAGSRARGDLKLGDLKLRLQVQVPEAVTEEERKLFEQLRVLHRKR